MELQPSGNSILIVEDDTQLRKNMALILKLEGFTVNTAADAFTGLTSIREHRPDIILCDILMPGMDGFAFQKIVQNDPAYADIVFIFVSALGDQAQIRKGMLAGADDYLPKPFTTEDLLAAVITRLSRKSVFRKPAEKPQVSDEQSHILKSISRREKEILLMVSGGSTSKEIAAQLYISPRTVEVNRARLMKKLGAINAASLSRWAELLERSSN